MMFSTTRRYALAIAAAAACALTLPVTATRAASAADLDRSSSEALHMLYKTNPTAASIGKHAHAVVIFPNIVKAGLQPFFTTARLAICNPRIGGYFSLGRRTVIRAPDSE